MIEWQVACKGCGRPLDEPPDLPGEARQPCPACGSLGRERTVLMVPGEASPPAGSTEAAWLNLGAALARAVSGLDKVLAEPLDETERDKIGRAREEARKALEAFRDGDRKLKEL